MIYLDTSAFVTLIQGEPETPALPADPHRPGRHHPCRARGGQPPDHPSLRSLDAIHLATALQLGGDLDTLVTHDSRLAAAGQQRLPVVTP